MPLTNAAYLDDRARSAHRHRAGTMPENKTARRRKRREGRGRGTGSEGTGSEREEKGR